MVKNKIFNSYRQRGTILRDKSGRIKKGRMGDQKKSFVSENFSLYIITIKSLSQFSWEYRKKLCTMARINVHSAYWTMNAEHWTLFLIFNRPFLLFEWRIYDTFIVLCFRFLFFIFGFRWSLVSSHFICSNLSYSYILREKSFR